MVDDEILRQFGEGMSMTELAEKYGCSTSGIRSRLLRHLTPAEIHDAILTMRRAGIFRTRHRKIPRTSAEKAAEAVAMYRDGQTLQRIGERFGVSRERVRQWIVAEGQRTKSLKRERIPILELVAPIAQCSACLGTVWGDRGKRSAGAEKPTCSQECHEDWVIARWYLDPEERHLARIRNAKSALKHPERLSASRERYFRRLLSGAKLGTHFQYEQPKPGTKVRAAYDRVMAKRAKTLGVHVAEEIA